MKSKIHKFKKETQRSICNKIIFMISAVGLLAASCTKSHVCTCTTQVTGVPDVTQKITIDGSNGNASKTCVGFEVVSPPDSASTTCVLE